MSTAPLSHPAPRPPSPPLAHREEPRDELGPWGRRGLVLGVVLVHLAGAWALQQGREPLPHPPQPTPIAVQWIALPTPAPEPAAPPPPSSRPAPRPTPAPPVLAAAPRPQPTAVTAPTPAATEPTPAAETAATPTPSAAPAPVTPRPDAAPAGPVQLPASALRYVTLPRQVYPATSRRLGETGTVLVQVIVDVHGQPRQVTLHRSSGHPRLDEQALQAMRAARFQPCRVEGHPVEAVAIAPLAYSLE
ncbi:TonB family protein [Ideonella sp. B7]|uniref:energy transducer TonB n=1 Tax=Ideonella benzenivorans TaxID=2831643 RepID=UPI001CEDA432|nr:energy transducer TonB [Ideonella benzenivorans]MCA6216555.1 TonB family protein [Ideonella benzenivorans]